MHSVHFVHIRYIKAYMNSGLILIKGVYEFRVNFNMVRLMAYFLVIMH